MTAPSNANTSGLIAEIDAEMEGRQRGYADVRGELLFRCRDALVTAASAQARISGLQREVAVAVAAADHMADRATAAEARADRLAKALEDISSGYANCDDFQDAQDIARAALQQETQP